METSLHRNLGETLKGFGGHLRCRECGREEPLGSVSGHLLKGWPTCCNGHTMEWLTASQLASNPPRQNP